MPLLCNKRFLRIFSIFPSFYAECRQSLDSKSLFCCRSFQLQKTTDATDIIFRMDQESLPVQPTMDVVEDASPIASFTNQFGKPTPQEVVLGEQLIGKKIAILWDGDKVFYPASIIKYDPSSRAYTVVYHKDESGSEYVENLLKTVWKIWRGTDAEFEDYFNQEVSGKYYSLVGERTTFVFLFIIPLLLFILIIVTNRFSYFLSWFLLPGCDQYSCHRC